MAAYIFLEINVLVAEREIGEGKADLLQRRVSNDCR